MSDEEDVSYQPDDADRELFWQIRNLIRRSPERFIGAGEYLDEQYSHEGIIRRQAKEKRQQHQDRKRVRTAMPLTRAGYRRHGLAFEPEPLQRDDGGLKHPPEENHRRHAAPRRFADGRRKPFPTFERFLAAISDVMSGDPLDIMVQRVRQLTAEQILLLTWLITDPDADQFRPILTNEFQCAGWRTVDPDGDLKTTEMGLWRPPKWQDDERGYIEWFHDRYWWRVTVFGFSPLWISWVRQAWKELSNVSPRVTGALAAPQGLTAIDPQQATSETVGQDALPDQNADTAHRGIEENQHPLALKKSDRLTLHTLAGFDARHIASVVDIEEAMPPAERISERTIRSAITRLVKRGLAERPDGPKSGARLTIEGRRLASTLVV